MFLQYKKEISIYFHKEIYTICEINNKSITKKLNYGLSYYWTNWRSGDSAI